LRKRKGGETKKQEDAKGPSKQHPRKTNPGGSFLIGKGCSEKHTDFSRVMSSEKEEGGSIT